MGTNEDAIERMTRELAALAARINGVAPRQRGRGRPPLDEPRNMVTVRLSIPRDILTDLEDVRALLHLADRRRGSKRRVTKSQMMRAALSDYLQKMRHAMAVND